MQFHVGQKVIYPNQGVGVIEQVTQMKVGENTTDFYLVRLTANDSTVMVPVGNAEHVGMRTLSDEATVDRLFDILAGDYEEPETDWKIRYKVNLEKMNSGEICEVARVLRNLHFLSFRKSLSFREKRMYDRARQLVVSEIATVRSRALADTEAEVFELLNASYDRAHVPEETEVAAD
ncbi:MAG TPA: CarD family transcriptional regulator [Acidobacteriota bacterium]|nr:CarD family transcriptional regulator [Acidobacteriota bacterium]HRR26818.1 CarD family transcriptional regulator [Acidobacteriota bacterium]HRR55844.1 CarD family transcriptional regulator [Acidobacteriota bacterium]HRV07666.1 CarD family transcriptional regulator [Acidobacteriota bacterium]